LQASDQQFFYLGREDIRNRIEHCRLRVISRDVLFEIEPAYRSFADHIVGATYTASDESGDARVFTQELALSCEAASMQFVYGHDIVRLDKVGDAIASVSLTQRSTGDMLSWSVDAFVVACGSYSASLLRTAAGDLSIYPGKGYSATFKL